MTKLCSRLNFFSWACYDVKILLFTHAYKIPYVYTKYIWRTSYRNTKFFTKISSENFVTPNYIIIFPSISYDMRHTCIYNWANELVLKNKLKTIYKYQHINLTILSNIVTCIIRNIILSKCTLLFDYKIQKSRLIYNY